jgi:hypothetical protein
VYLWRMFAVGPRAAALDRKIHSTQLSKCSMLRLMVPVRVMGDVLVIMSTVVYYHDAISLSAVLVARLALSAATLGNTLGEFVPWSLTWCRCWCKVDTPTRKSPYFEHHLLAKSACYWWWRAAFTLLFFLAACVPIVMLYAEPFHGGYFVRMSIDHAALCAPIGSAGQFTWERQRVFDDILRVRFNLQGKPYIGRVRGGDVVSGNFPVMVPPLTGACEGGVAGSSTAELWPFALWYGGDTNYWDVAPGASSLDVIFPLVNALGGTSWLHMSTNSSVDSLHNTTMLLVAESYASDCAGAACNDWMDGVRVQVIRFNATVMTGTTICDL